MSRDGTPRHHLADGLHHRGKEPAAHFFRSRPCMDSRQCWLGVAVCEPVRIEWCRHCLLWLVHLSRIADLSDRSHAQRVPMVGGKQEGRYPLSLLDRLGFLWLASVATHLGGSSRSNGNGRERHLFPAPAAASSLYGPDSTADPAASAATSIGPSRSLM